jgi:hypothetical protein
MFYTLLKHSNYNKFIIIVCDGARIKYKLMRVMVYI